MAALGVFTDVYRAKYGGLAQGAGSDPRSGLQNTTFKMGEASNGTYPGPLTPKPPDATLTDIVSDGVTFGKYTKAFAGTSSVVHSAGVVTMTCVFDAVEVGVDNNGIIIPGGTPLLFEAGVFDAEGAMIVHVTFDQKIKSVGSSVTVTIALTL